MDVVVACSKRSDSGERRELGKATEKTRGDWGEGAEGSLACPSIFPRLFRLLFSAPLPYSSRLSPLSERLEQDNAVETRRCPELNIFTNNKESVLTIEKSATNLALVLEQLVRK